jgi:dUTP pyrophosphatase
MPKHGIERAINFVQVMQRKTPCKTKSRVLFSKVSMDTKIVIPRKKHKYDAGYDLQSTTTVKIPPGGMMLMKTGLKCSIPRGYFGLIKARSSLAIAGISVEGGVIDSGYEGELIAILVN